MKKIFCINFILGSLLLFIIFINLAVVSLTYTFEPGNIYNINEYISVGIVDLIFLIVIIIVNCMLFKKAAACNLKMVLKYCIMPLLIPTIIALLVVLVFGMLEGTPKQAIAR